MQHPTNLGQGAAIQTGLATPGTAVPCPGRIEIGERSIPNYNEFSLGTVPMATAFARSCNTSFAKLASEMNADDLTVAASTFGIGPDYSVTGLPTVSGSVPPASDTVQRTEDGFGQGKVVLSPFGMAIAAASIARGGTVAPPASGTSLRGTSGSSIGTSSSSGTVSRGGLGVSGSSSGPP